METAYFIDLATGKVEVLPQDEVVSATQGLEKWETPGAVTYAAEEYVILIPKNKSCSSPQ